MSKRKISECINIRINVGNYQHIELVKHAEEEIEYANEQERIEAEDRLTNELVQSMIRSMKAIPQKLGKGVENAVEVEERIKKAIPEWLISNPVPNLVDTSKKMEVKSAAEQKDKKDSANQLIDDIDETKESSADSDETKGLDDDASDEPLFEDDIKEGATEEVTETIKDTSEPAEEKTEEKKKEVATSDLFDDDDLFE